MNLVRPLSAHCPLVLLLLASAQLMLQAQGQKFEGKEVANIQFDPSRQPLEPEELSEILPLKMHAPLRVADVRASIERLYATGRYADIQVDVKPSDSGVSVTFITKNSWFVGDVSLAGSISSPPTPRNWGMRRGWTWALPTRMPCCKSPWPGRGACSKATACTAARSPPLSISPPAKPTNKSTSDSPCRAAAAPVLVLPFSWET